MPYVKIATEEASHLHISLCCCATPGHAALFVGPFVCNAMTWVQVRSEQPGYLPGQGGRPQGQGPRAQGQPAGPPKERSSNVNHTGFRPRLFRDRKEGARRERSEEEKEKKKARAAPTAPP